MGVSAWIRVVGCACVLAFAGACAPSSESGDETDSGGTDATAQVVNVYSARHYDTDDALFATFTEETGIEVKIIEANADELIARIEREGELSPADVLIVVDAARLYRAEVKDLFQSVESEALSARVPASRRHPEGLWFGLTERARVIVASNERVPEGDEPRRYEDLADSAWAGRVLIRSSSNVYNQSLVASMVSTLGAEATEAWCEGIAANFAREPQGGDRDQIRAVAAGEGDVAVVNHYYLAHMLSGNEADRAAGESVRVIFPNQDDRGTHVNICGAGVIAGAPNRENAVRFLEYLVSVEAQRSLAGGNFEYPVVEDASPVEVVAGFGAFVADEVVVSEYGEHNAEAVQVMDRAGWR